MGKINMLSYAMVLIGFAVSIVSADMLVKGASSVAHRLKISDMTIGLTVVAFGTLSVNIPAALKETRAA